MCPARGSVIMDDIRNVSDVVKERKGRGREITGHPGMENQQDGVSFSRLPSYILCVWKLNFGIISS